MLKKPIPEHCKQLCDRDSDYGALQCKYTTSGCPGSNNGNCYPREVWSGSANGDNKYYYYLNNGTFKESSQSPLYADSVRCVLGFDFIESGKCFRYEDR